MAHNFEFAARMVRLRAPLFAAMILAFSGCDTTESVSPESLTPAEPGVETASVTEPSFAAVSFAGGIPIGTTGQPTSQYGAVYNGALRIISSHELMRELAGIKARGGKIMLNLAGGQRRFRDARGRFSLAKWKISVDRYRNLNLASYIKDGTIIGHYLIDEPHDKTNWAGTTVSTNTLDEMAKYSKQRWPGMATIVRAYPEYLLKHSGPYRYLDAASAHYTFRKGPLNAFVTRNLAQAKTKGLALVVGLNILKGGPGGRKMTAGEVKSWGSALLSSSYPCAFVSWMYDPGYLSSASMKDAMRYLRSKAQNRGRRTCHA